ncbi:GTP cyclohydrolase II [Lutibacter holmesii]|uniref:GTP cyclohydrolase-2 n=1 Tax=Lutibacter holmesii TaxID=1137985 RepID=A0ABW3WR56_9FLAO
MPQKETTVLVGERVKLPTKYGDFELVPFQEKKNGLEHMALVKGNFTENDTVITRIHSACATGDLFGSLKCDCGDQLIKAIQTIEENGKGAIIYLQQEGRGIGLMNKMKAYKLQENGMDTIEANLHLGFAPDERKYQIAAIILNLLHIKNIKLLTNNPDKIDGLTEHGIQVVERIPLIIKPNPFNINYLQTKKKQMGHLYEINKLAAQ